MSRRSWTARLPAAYEAIMAPVEVLGMRRLRARLRDGLPRSGRGLELGAGSAHSVEAAGRTGLVGTDISAAMLRRARARLPAAQLLVAADVQSLPFPADSFDWVVASLLFCEVADPERGLLEAGRVLRAGGTLHLLEHVRPRGALLGAAASLLSRATAPLFGEHFDRRTDEAVARAGFAIETAEWHLRGSIVVLVARRHERQER